MRNKMQPRGADSALRELGYMPEADLFGLLNISPATGRNRQCAGTLPPHYKLGKAKVYRIPEVEAWIRRQRVVKA